MSEKKDKRADLDHAASHVVESYREHGIRVDYDKTRERLRQNLIREEKQNKPRR